MAGGRRARRARPVPSPSSLELPMMHVQRWTLAVVCAATAMLMLDIAVVNTALSRIADDLDTGLSGLQWVVDAYTLALASDGPDRRRARRPARPPQAVPRSASACSPSARSVVRWRATSRCSTACAPCRASARRSCSRSRWRCSPPPIPTSRQRAGALAAYGATIGARLRDRAARRRRADQRARLALDLPHQPPDRRVLHRRHARLRAGVARSRRARGSTGPGQTTLTARPVPARARAAARPRGRLGQRARSSARSPAPPRCSPRSWRSRRASPSRCCRWGCSATARSPARRSRRSPSRRRSSRSSSTRRSTCSRSSACRRSRPAWPTCRARSRCCSSAPRRARSATKVSARVMVGGRARARRRRAWSCSRSPTSTRRGR